MNFLETKCVLSKVKFRDGIFVDSINIKGGQQFSILGEVKSSLIELNSESKFTNFMLKFEDVIMYECVSLDFSKLDKEMSSQFNIIEGSEFMKGKDLEGYSHYVLSTYDHVFQIVSRGYVFELNID